MAWKLRFRSGLRVPAVVAMLLVPILSATMAAQFGWERQGWRLPEGRGVIPEMLPDNATDGTFAVCKVMYSSVWREAGGTGWATDYPYAAHNLMIRLSELSRTRISRRHAGSLGEGSAPLRADGEPTHWVVRLTDDALFDCPFTMAADVGTIGLAPEEVERLREYLLKGGFLWVDDFWGNAAWERWSNEIRRALPEYPIVDVPAEHPVRRTVFQVDAVPQVPNIGFWRRTGGATGERGAESPRANFRMIADDDGRIMVIMTHNTDVADSWEREGEDPAYFMQFSPDGYALGINVAVYALTH